MDAGVSPALVHYHYATREALLAEALDYSFSHAGEARISDEVPGTSAAERLRAMIDQCLPTSPELEEDWVLWVELWLRAARHPELRPVAEELYARLHDWFATEIAAGVEREEFAACDPADVADRVLALIDGYGIRSLIGDSRFPVDRVRTAIWDALARELGL
jgi:AcrR family transcriptional regulator